MRKIERISVGDADRERLELYAISDLQRWADRGLRTSTSDHGTDIVYPAQPVMLKKPFRG
jgi:hypothetical protein